MKIIYRSINALRKEYNNILDFETEIALNKSIYYEVELYDFITEKPVYLNVYIIEKCKLNRIGDIIIRY